MRRCPWRPGTTMPRSSHHCSWRAVIPVRAITSLDVNCRCIFNTFCFKQEIREMFDTFYAATVDIHQGFVVFVLTTRVPSRKLACEDAQEQILTTGCTGESQGNSTTGLPS